MPKGSTAAPPEAPPGCPLCPRLTAFRAATQQAHPEWFNGAVPSFGDASGRLVIVGLAPGLQGANKTGRPFTGDYAGELLFSSLAKYAVRCVPPENKPTGAEILTCRQFLISRLNQLPRLKVIMALGRIAHDSTVRALGAKPSSAVFGHARRHALEGPQGPVILHDSYHCSRYNTNTGRLTERMFHDVFDAIRKDLDG
jgi:uracil-DNA glycosylase family 4